MVGAADHQRAPAAGGRLGEPPGEVVGLAARAHEKADRQRRRQGGGQPFGVAQDALVQVAGIGVEQGHLAAAGFHHPRMAVADVGHVVDRVEVGVAQRVDQAGAAAAHHVQRPAVGKAEVFAERAGPPGQQLLRRRHRRRQARFGMPKSRLGSGHNPSQTSRSDGAATPGYSPRRSSRSNISWKCRCGAQPPFSPTSPRVPSSSPASTCWPIFLPASERPRQVAVEAVERNAAGGLVLEQEGRAVVAGGGVVGEAVDKAGERRENRPASRLEEVDPEVDGAPFSAVAARHREGVGEVDRPRFGIAAGRHPHIAPASCSRRRAKAST